MDNYYGNIPVPPPAEETRKKTRCLFSPASLLSFFRSVQGKKSSQVVGKKNCEVQTFTVLNNFILFKKTLVFTKKVNVYLFGVSSELGKIAIFIVFLLFYTFFS